MLRNTGRYIFTHRRHSQTISSMAQQPSERYFCSTPEEAIAVQKVETEGSARTLYTYFETDHFSTGFEWVEVGCEVPLHKHDVSEELIFCTHGEGLAHVAEEQAVMKPGVLVCIPPGTDHKFVNTSKERLGFTWTLNPPRNAKKFMPGLNQESKS
eukprot:TRINITY_DN16448_c0_g1_i1.p1 TRINITY_DN16448_c0_g1~~TRINITY_DN16448_c0_g1_i1.p1  ORF type:complete len:155 (+),score=21.26 TRINITY_DN16448_c0_g1_i1:164-628(+)